MEFLRNTWYLAAWGHHLKPGELFPRIILNEPIVLFRDADGRAIAFEDRCPHRFAPLSRGKLREGRLMCGYHGLEFDTSGACVRNPHGSGKIPAGARVRSYPVVERHAALWIWMGDKDADPALIPDFGVLDNPDHADVLRLDYMVMDAPYELIVDNLLDCSHTCFVHDGILANEEMTAIKTTIKRKDDAITVSRFAPDAPIPSMFALAYQREGIRIDGWTDIRWDAPACMLLDTGVTEVGCPRQAGTGALSVHVLTPETHQTAHYYFSGRRWGVRPGGETHEMREKVADLRRFAFEQQDEPMIRAQHRIMQLTPSSKLKPVILETDVGVVGWRRIMEKLIVAEQSPLVES